MVNKRFLTTLSVSISESVSDTPYIPIAALQLLSSDAPAQCSATIGRFAVESTGLAELQIIPILTAHTAVTFID